MKAVVGLGNPGSIYTATRHNAGFWVVDAVARKLGVALKSTRRQTHEAVGAWRGTRLLLAEPRTYMNRSGLAVKAIVDAYNLDPSDLMVVVDELALAPGMIRLRQKGSSGGHKGMESIIHYLGTQAFPRLRVGIGPVPEGTSGAEYVLSPPGRDEKEHLDAAVLAAVEAIFVWVEEGLDRAMARYNRAYGPGKTLRT